MENINSGKRSTVIRIVKIVVMTLLLCFLMSLLLTWYLNKIPETVSSLEEEKMPNTVWVVKYGSVALPLFAVAVILTVAYRGRFYHAVDTQIDKAIIVGCVCAFTYFVLLTLILKRSPLWWEIQEVDGEEVKTLFERSVIWFSAQTVPFLIMIPYHIYKASCERRELLEGGENEDAE